MKLKKNYYKRKVYTVHVILLPFRYRFYVKVLENVIPNATVQR